MMLAPRFKWLLILLVGAWLVGSGLVGCSATPVPIPGGPDGMVSVRDAGTGDAAASRDGVVFPDAGVVPSSDAGADAAPTDADLGDAEAGSIDAEAGLDDALATDGDAGEDDAQPDSLLAEGGV